MSHLLSNPMQKPYVFDLPRAVHPLTPPDTDNEFNSQSYSSAPMHGIPNIDPESASSHVAGTETPAPLYRRPSVAYINSASREPRERLPQRSLIKWLVVVIPPASFTREHGHLGHTLSSGPINRLPQGILMPLFPTLGGQLGAIAREFSLPSTAGVCLYLNTTHNGVALYPRISDESWHLLWAHLFEARSPAAPQQQLPISGQIEFDIDLAKARWYDAWIASSRREFADVPHSVAHSRRQSMTHWRGDSRTSFIDDPVDDQVDSVSVSQGRVAPNAPRLAPKKLSLLDRFDGSSVVSASRQPRHLSPHSPTEEAQLRILSPIVQEEEPRTARRDIDSLVHSWRATASVAASPLAVTGQTSLDPANMPNTFRDIPTVTEPDARSELNLDDYAWSVSSAGPPDYDYDDDVESFWRLPSPDIAMRVLSDAPPTPSTVTSWGAPLSYPPSPIEQYSVYAPSVDIAGRAMSSRPVTPSTATSWGPPSYPASPAYHEHVHRVASPDLGARGMLSVPPTPSTATSWGPPSFPASPAYREFRVPSPDLGARGMLSVPASPLPVRLRRNVASLNTSAGSHGSAGLWEHVWPYNAENHNRDERNYVQSGSSLVFPYYRAPAQMWNHSWPYQRGSEDDQSARDGKPTLSSLVFPYYTAPRATQSDASDSVHSLIEGASTRLWSHVWPYQQASSIISDQTADGTLRKQVWPSAISSQRSVRDKNSGANYPYFNLYPAVYPHFDIYPSTVRAPSRRGHHDLSVSLPAAYPSLIIYPAVYPCIEIYPASVDDKADRLIETPKTPLAAPKFGSSLMSQYPTFQLYPPVYPWNLSDIYPTASVATVLSSIRDAVTVQLRHAYPLFNLYAAVYPHNLESIYPALGIQQKPASSMQAITVQLPVHYPHFDIYPAVYPYNLCPYPATLAKVETRRELIRVVLESAQYPYFELYPAVYPHNLRRLYPAKTAYQGYDEAATRDVAASPIVPVLPTLYPAVVPYPAVYPWNMLRVYPPAVAVDKIVLEKTKTVAVHLETSYPHFKLYRSVYPHNLAEIYPQVSHSNVKPVSTSTTTAPYPHFAIYPAVYPHNLTCIYPSTLPDFGSDTTSQTLLVASTERNALLTQTYPYICPYPAVYPHLRIYPDVTTRQTLGKHEPTNRSLAYPVIEIYPAVYPFMSIYPSVWVSERDVPTRQTLRKREPTRRSSAYPVIEIYPAVYPHLKIYPDIPIRQIPGKHEPTKRSLAYPVIEIYSAVYPFMSIYPSVWISERMVLQRGPDDAGSPPNNRDGIRRKPRYTHLELHQQVFAAYPSENGSLSRTSPTHRPEVPSGSVGSRTRSGTVSMRPIPPPRPSTVSGQRPPPPPIPSLRPGSSASARLSIASVPKRPLSTTGLPSNPAANRRMSSTVTRSTPSMSTPLATVKEPGESTTSSNHRQISPVSSSEISRTHHKALHQIDVELSPSIVHTGQSSSATLPPRLPVVDVGAELNRSKTLPSSGPASRGRRASVVLQKARAYDQTSTTDDAPVRITMSTLAQFPTPPRPPVPPLPNARPVSKLDRSKYPFA